MAINLSTAGIHLYYSVEKTTGSRPTAKGDFIDLTGVKSIPSLNPAPDTLETTDLNQTTYKTYIDGLKDLGGALEFTFNMTQELVEKWEALMTAYEAGKSSNKATWFYIDIPGLTEVLMFTGNPSSMGMPEAAVNAVLEITNYITPTNAPDFYARPTAG